MVIRAAAKNHSGAMFALGAFTTAVTICPLIAAPPSAGSAPLPKPDMVRLR
jgi:hypothetical protein